VGDARQWIAQHAALAQHHQDEVFDAVAQVIEAVFRPPGAHQANERADAQGEDHPRRDQHDGKENCPDETA